MGLPLRDRKGDIPLLAEHFVQKHRSTLGGNVSGVSNEAMELLERYHWPGNVRDLERCIRRALIIEKSALIQPSSLLDEIRQYQPECLSPESNARLKPWQEKERQTIVETLEQCDWNVKKTAEVLGWSRRTLHRKINEYGIKRPQRPSSNAEPTALT